MLILYAIAALFAYLMGSIPFGYVLMRVFRGEDVRAIGSGNIGATNVARKAPGLGLLTLVLDATKGFLAVVLVSAALPRCVGYIGGTPWRDEKSITVVVAALGAILGHLYPIWLKFRGGKGVATGVGAFLAIAPKAVAVVLIIFLAIVIASRYVSLGSIAAAAAFPLFAFLLYRGEFPLLSLVIMIAASALIIARHHQNIRRLLAGTEHRFELKRTRA